MTKEIIILLILLIVAVLLYSSSWIGITATSMLILAVLYVTGIVDASDLFANFINSSTLLVIFMFVISGALLQSGASALIGRFMLWKVSSEKQLAMRFLLISMILSAFFSNMATAVVVVTFAVGITQTHPQYRLPKLSMFISAGSILGGMLTIIGVSGNVMVRSVLEEAGVGTIGFWDFGKIGLPLCIAGYIYMYFAGYRLAPSEAAGYSQNIPNSEETNYNRRKCIFSIVVFALVVVGMMLENVIGIPIQITAFLGCLVLIVSGVVSEKEAFSYINWPTTIMFASLLTLGNAVSASGAATLISENFLQLFPEGTNTTLILTAFFVIIAILTQFMSNGATSAVFYPIGLSMAQMINVNPTAVLMMVCVAAASSFATPMATPLNAYLMSVSGCKFSDYMKVGLPLLVVTTVICVLLCPIIWRL
ncbi:MAG: SLC13 family permease [Lachnospiraceae bacterium]|nr:SLC13 family permease [Lachnospiraceae bacterium]